MVPAPLTRLEDLARNLRRLLTPIVRTGTRLVVRPWVVARVALLFLKIIVKLTGRSIEVRKIGQGPLPGLSGLCNIPTLSLLSLRVYPLVYRRSS